MSAIIFIVGLFICLLSVLIQDVRYRRIHIIFPPLIYLFIYLSININAFSIIDISIYNSFFLLLVLLGLVLYMSIKNKRFLNPFEHYFGLGDLLFYLSITPAFVLKNYILFFIASMLFAVIMQLLFIKKMKNQTVPLAGFSALFLMLVVAIDEFYMVPKITLL